MTDDVQVLPLGQVEGLPESLRAWAARQDVPALGIVSAGALIGAAVVTIKGSLRWQFLDDADERLAVRGLDAVIEHAFAAMGLHRVQARVRSDDHARSRLASRAGLRKEGIVRGGSFPTDASDEVQFARIAADPPLRDRATFTAVLNAGMPTKRCIAQALVRDQQGRILLCELVYKKFWDLPGGVVDPHESPADAVVRELREELDVDAYVQGLAAVSWLPPWRGWDDATLFVFDVELDRSPHTLQPREIKAVHWVAPDELDAHVADYTARVVRAALAAPTTVYLEDGRPRF